MGLSNLLNLRAWQMINVDTGETLRGQFEAVDPRTSVGASYAEHVSLNRQSAITQFLHGNVDVMTFRVRLFANHMFKDITADMNKLIEWTRRRDREARPPIIVFWMGNGDVYLECIIQSVTDISYDRLTFFGGMRGVTMSVTLRKYVPFQIGGLYIHETRYHRAKSQDYYEMLTYREYNSPLKGDLIRRNHPDKPSINPADVIKLPSIAAIRKVQVKPHSPIYEDCFVRTDTPEKELRQHMFDQRNRSYTSHVV